MANDAEIGRNLIRLRGSGSQKDLADAMRKKGFRWSQATVWAVEKGERPLRLTEAEALGEVFGIPHQALLSTGEQLDLTMRIREFEELLEDIVELAYASYAEQRQLATFIDLVPADQLDGITIDIVQRTAVDAAIEGLGRAAAHHRGLLEVDDSASGAADLPAQRFTGAFESHLRHLVDAHRSESSANDQAESP